MLMAPLAVCALIAFKPVTLPVFVIKIEPIPVLCARMPARVPVTEPESKMLVTPSTALAKMPSRVALLTVPPTEIRLVPVPTTVEKIPPTTLPLTSISVLPFPGECDA